MTPELQRYYEDRLDMMGSEGWKDLMDDVADMMKATDTLSGTTPENLRFKQGEISIMQWLLSLKEISEAAYQDLQNEDSQGL